MSGGLAIVDLHRHCSGGEGFGSAAGCEEGGGGHECGWKGSITVGLA